MVKRALDIVVSSVLLMVALPLLAVAAVMIVTTSPGPVLFRQTRMGRGFRPFKILKLRTMAHAEAGLAFTLGPDPRITPVGKWLRRSKVDELPQLWNVLCGDMSLVGPRPVLPELTREFHDDYRILLSVRPGLTDPASLKYCQETQLLARSEDPMRFFKSVVTPDKIRMSSEYIEQANLWTDCLTLVMTALICCFPSMSRVYGELPEILGATDVLALREKLLAGATDPPVDESIFSRELAYLEAAEEEASRLGGLPWIPQQNREFKRRSAASSAKESA